MASSQLVLSNPLCFLSCRFGKSTVQQLKSVVSDFYKSEELIAAKEQLLEDVNRLDPPIILPHIPTRREGEARTARVVDDIFTLLTTVDENLRMNSLPNYVADSPDCMPATRLYDGDLAVLMALFEKMNGRLSECGSSVAAMFSELMSLKEQVKVLSTNLPPTNSAGGGGVAGAGISTGYKHRQSTTCASVATVTGPPMAIQSSHTATDSVENVDGDNQSLQSLLQSGDNWAAVAMSSPVIATSNRFAAFRSSDDNNYCDSDGTDPQLFQEVRSRQAVKRRRQHTADQQQQQQQSAESRRREAGEQQAGRQARQRNGRLLTGTSSNRGLAAAKKLVKKKVFCIDNVDTSFSPDDVQRYVSSFSVNVLSCFPTKPRRRRNENEPITDRRAFRLCIDANDQDKLLDPAKWPDSITIAEWYHLSPSARRLQHGDTDGETGSAVGGSSSDVRESAVSDVAVTAAVRDNEVTEDTEDMENDDTVLEINLDTAVSTHHVV